MKLLPTKRNENEGRLWKQRQQQQLHHHHHRVGWLGNGTTNSSSSSHRPDQSYSLFGKPLNNIPGNGGKDPNMKGPRGSGSRHTTHKVLGDAHSDPSIRLIRPGRWYVLWKRNAGTCKLNCTQVIPAMRVGFPCSGKSLRSQSRKASLGSIQRMRADDRAFHWLIVYSMHRIISLQEMNSSRCIGRPT